MEFENDSVRVLRISIAPHERSIMHDHPDCVAIFMTDQSARFTYPAGNTEVLLAKAGEAKWMPAFTHLPENLADEPLELVLVELKK